MEEKNNKGKVLKSLILGGIIGVSSVVAISIAVPLTMAGSLAAFLATASLVSGAYPAAGFGAGILAGLSTIGLAGYGGFKAARGVYRAVKNSTLDKGWTAIGAAAGVVGVMIIPDTAPPEIVPEIKKDNTNKNIRLIVNDLGKEFGNANPLYELVAREVARSENERGAKELPEYFKMEI